MTRFDFEQIPKLKIEIKKLAEEVVKAEKSIVADSVIGSRLTVPYDAHIIFIEGVDSFVCIKLKRRLQRKLDELRDLLFGMEEKIDQIPDATIRTIVRLYYRNGLSQQEIGRELHYSQQRVSQILDEFWKEAEC